MYIIIRHCDIIPKQRLTVCLTYIIFKRQVILMQTRRDLRHPEQHSSVNLYNIHVTFFGCSLSVSNHLIPKKC